MDQAQKASLISFAEEERQIAEQLQEEEMNCVCEVFILPTTLIFMNALVNNGVPLVFGALLPI